MLLYKPPMKQVIHYYMEKVDIEIQTIDVHHVKQMLRFYVIHLKHLKIL